MSRPPKRNDRRISARIETLVHLFDVPRARIEKAAADGRIRPSDGVFGVPLYHVETIERAIFGPATGEAPAADTPAGDDPVLRRITKIGDARKAKHRGLTA